MDQRSNNGGASARRSTPIAIVGMSCLFPKAQSLQEYWSNIKRGVDAIGEVPPNYWSSADYYDPDPKKPDHVYAKRGGFLDPVDFDPGEFGIAPSNIEATDPSQLLGLVVAHGALTDAGYGPDRDYNRSRVSCILGVTGTLQLSIALGARLAHPVWRKALLESGLPAERTEEIVKNIGDSFVMWQENSFPGLLGNVVAGRIANRFNLGGANCVVDAACASSVSAIHLAVLELETGRADMVLTGGVDTFNDVFMYTCFSKTPALSPTGDARPFAADADGTILGEGIGMVALKRLEDAERDGDRVYAVIKGIGRSSDGRGKAIYAPSADGQRRALEDAYRQAAVSPDTIGLVEAHGTGTKVGDAVEVSALKRVYRAARENGVWCALGSVKSQIGHTKAAAGVAGLIKVALALKHKVLPPTIKVAAPNPEFDRDGGSPFYVNTEPRPWLTRPGHPRRAAVSAFGFGGSNFHLVAEEAETRKAEIDWDGRVQIAAFSADSVEALRTALRAFVAHAPSWKAVCRAAAESRRNFHVTQPCRLVFVIEQGKTDLDRLLRVIEERIESESDKMHWALPEGVFFSRFAKPGLLSFLIPGQGAQYVGMCRDLSCIFPKMQDILMEADLAYGDMADLACQLSDFIFPHAAFGDEARRLNDLALRATHVAQPAIGAIGMGLICVLASFGVHPAMAGGHSFGELVALFAGGKISAEDMHRLARLRGEMMNNVPGEKGAMLAVHASLDQIHKAIDEEGLQVVVANRNAPAQAVLSGRTEEIERALAAFRLRKISATQLPVAGAFHSPLVAAAAEPFREALEEIDLAAGDIPVYSNTLAQPYPDDPDLARDLLGHQLARPVAFAEQIEAMHAAGARTFLEVGPGGRLTALVKSILNGKEHTALAVDASSGKGDGVVDLARALAQLAALGHPVDLAQWDPQAGGPAVDASKKPRMTVQLTGALVNGPFSITAKGASDQTSSKLAESTGKAPAPAVPAIPFTAPMREIAPMPSTAPAPPKEAPVMSTPAPPPDARRNGGGIVAPAPITPPPIAAHAFAPAPSPAPSYPSSSPALRAAPASGSAPTPPAAVVAPPRAQTSAALAATLLEVVSEKTGYPTEMLSLDMDLEGDLGIDSIKRVEIMSALQERAPDLPAVQPDELGKLRTLAQVLDRLGEAAAVSAPAAPAARPAPAAPSSFDPLPDLIAVVAEKTGYPPEMLNADMDLEGDLGIDSIKRVEIMSAFQERVPDAPAVQPEELGKLRTLAQVAAAISGARPSAPAPLASPIAVASSAATSSGALAEALLAVVAEKTGYPPEMLNVDMDLEGDLGIDSIKRVEIMSALQDRMPELPAASPEELGKLRTLAQIISHLGAGPRDLPPPTNGSNGSNGHHAEPLIDSESEAVEVPLRRAELVRAPLDPSPRERVHLRAGSCIWVTDDGSELSRAVASGLEALGHRARVVGVDGEDSASPPPDLAGVVVIAPPRRLASGALWDDASERFLKAAFALVQRVAKPLRAAGGARGALLATVSRMDGAFGLGGHRSEFDPLSGALAGLSKTASREWPEIACKTLDLDLDWGGAEAASAVLDELLVHGPLEVGLAAEGSCEPREDVRDAEPLNGLADAGRALEPGDVVVVSGGARGVTAEAAVALAEACKVSLALLGRSAPPEPEPAWIASAHTESDLKRAIAAKGNGHPLTPREVERECRRWMAGREISSTLDRIQAAGGRAIYIQADARDAAQIAAAVERVRAELGPVAALVHGAGVLADKLIEEKNPEQFAEVFDTKIRGLRALLEACSAEPLKAIALFSSVSGRYGRRGQADYAMANEALSKIAQREALARPDARVVAVAWGPWDGGMVHAGLRKVFESEGIGLIPLRAGARLLADELASKSRAAEIVVSARVEADESTSSTADTAPPTAGLRVAFERRLDVDSHVFLRSHVINGRAVLPMAMVIEWLAHGALAENPGYVFCGLDDLRILRGVTLDESESRPMCVVAGPARAKGMFLAAEVELRGVDDGGRPGPLHARAEVLMAGGMPVSAERPKLAISTAPYGRPLESAYNDVLFHGPHFHGVESVESFSEEGIAARVKCAPKPALWMADPPRGSWLADPLALDSAFHLMTLWAAELHAAPSLPTGLESYRQFARFPRGGVDLRIRAAKGRAATARAEMEFVDADGLLIARVKGYECVMDPSLVKAFRRNSLMAEASS